MRKSLCCLLLLESPSLVQSSAAGDQLSRDQADCDAGGGLCVPVFEICIYVRQSLFNAHSKSREGPGKCLGESRHGF